MKNLSFIKFLVICAAVALCGVVKAQPMMPSFKGGDIMTFRNWVVKNAELTKAQKKSDFKAQICFYVNSQGDVEQVKILNATNQEIANIYKAAVENSPKWQPAQQNGKKVGVRMVLPIGGR